MRDSNLKKSSVLKTTVEIPKEDEILDPDYIRYFQAFPLIFHKKANVIQNI